VIQQQLHRYIHIQLADGPLSIMSFFILTVRFSLMPSSVNAADKAISILMHSKATDSALYHKPAQSRALR